MKNFRDWFKLKTKINNGNKIIYFHERELWWINLGVNVGSEQDGVGYKFLRPVVIIKKFNKKIFWGIPLTTKDKKGLFYYHFNFKNKKEIAEISQLKLIDSKFHALISIAGKKFVNKDSVYVDIVFNS